MKFVTKKDIVNWLESVGVGGYTINEDLTVDVEGSVHLFDQVINELPVQFGVIDGDFRISGEIKTLSGCPYKVNSFYCNNTKIKTLEGGPKIVKSIYNVDNNELTSLLGSPEYVPMHFAANNNQLTSLKDSPKKIGLMASFLNNPFDSFEHNFEKISKEIRLSYSISGVNPLTLASGEVISSLTLEELNKLKLSKKLTDSIKDIPVNPSKQFKL